MNYVARKGTDYYRTHEDEYEDEMKDYCTCTRPHFMTPQGVESMRCAYCGKKAYVSYLYGK